ncbi:hypothetical protein [Spirochaeta thermophila]|uniref:Porin domain-containing protein n=1 Tax=Winmispira thermophila (strain ATCC 49972 / DSM 6192 / RI 19.B1) TaxID=665571 RepID=E0RNQ6_WINT6|nr:hypothetical protein [Spirochaeta thermophila]ADN01179.1 hypothetical protein STHERM_c02050 [Spirochaeta thermophila DSM 6192]
MVTHRSKWIILSTVLLLGVIPLWSEQQIRVIMDTALFGMRIDEETWSLFSTGSGELDLQSRGNRNVRARLSLTASLGQEVGTDEGTSSLTGRETATFGIHYAYVKVRIPLAERYAVRLSMGKNALTWGVGSLFNAGNIAFNPTATQGASLLAVEGPVREDTAWYASLYLPLGTYAFLEPVALVALAPASEAPLFPTPEETSLGARLHTKAGPLLLEAAYLHDGREARHVGALTLQGNLGADLYLSVSSSLPGETDDILSSLKEGLIISTGAFWLNPIEVGEGLSLRIEALVIPDASWEEGTAGDLSDYGIHLYHELSLAPSDRLTLLFRGLLSPIDLSGVGIAGLDWNLDQGLHLYSFFSLQVGEETDLYSPSHPGGIALAGGVRYTF